MERKTASVREQEAIAAALRIIERDGIGAVSVRKVATEAGMSAGSLRHIFPQHADLLIAILRDAERSAHDRISAVLTQAEDEQWDERKTVIAALLEALPLTQQSLRELQAQLAILISNPGNPAVLEARASVGAGLDGLCGMVVRRVRGGVEKKEEEKGDGEDLKRQVTRLRLLLDGLALNIVEKPGWTRERAAGVLLAELYGL